MKMTKDLTLLFFTILTFVFINSYNAEPIAEPVVEEIGTETRDSKVLPVFQVVKFPNAICAGSTSTNKNGTCYTSEECSSLGGTSDGSCASGFGVCCVFSLSCGESSSENVTYLSQSSVTSLTSPCTYTICPCSSQICRIRFDLTTFVLASAVAGTTSSGATGTAASLAGPALGDCVDDSFSVSGGLGGGSPVICGTNTGYHMIVDADPSGNSCHYANFLVGGTTSTSRTWDVKVTQYACGDTDSSGWPGCLQYFTATAGNVASFGFSPTATTVTSGVTHLQNQVYDICFRRASGYCYICYTPYVSSTTATAATTDEATQQSYGLSTSSVDANAESQIASDCSTDWLDIPIANTAANAAIATPTASAVITNVSRFCGRILGLGDSIDTTTTVCTRALPFKIGVNFNREEADETGESDAMAATAENSEVPGGIVGFKLTFFQGSC